MSRFGKRLDGLEPSFPERAGLSLTANMTDAECAKRYRRLLAGETLQEVFPDAEIEPDPEPSLIDDACDGLSVHELTALYTRMIRCTGRDETRALLRDQVTRNRSRRT